MSFAEAVHLFQSLCLFGLACMLALITVDMRRTLRDMRRECSRIFSMLPETRAGQYSESHMLISSAGTSENPEGVQPDL